MKVLVLSCNTGEGHNSVARAMTGKLEQYGAEVEMIDSLSFGFPGLSRLICHIHTWFYRHAPKVYGSVYDYVGSREKKVKRSFLSRLNSSYSRAMERYIKDNSFDAVVAVHVFPAETLTAIRRKSRLDIPTYFVATDYTCSPGVGETALDYYIIPHAELADEFAACGIPREKLLPLGIPLRDAFASEHNQAAARRAIGLDEQGKVILLMSGSMGAGHLDSLVATLMTQLTEDTSVVVLCGRNERLRMELKTIFGNDPRVRVEGLVEDTRVYMDAADLLYTKGGGLSTTEAAVRCTPILHLAAVPGCESRNIDFFAAHQLSGGSGTPHELAAKGHRLLDDWQRRQEIMANQQEQIPANAADELCKLILTETN